MEYEYSYKVDDLKCYLKYASKYKFLGRNYEKIIIYRNNDNIARITFKDNKMYLDFKENKISNDDLIIRKESKKIMFDNLSNCESILSFLGYQKDNTIIRYRSIYMGDKIKFEIDEYEKPHKELVVSFEGEKEICDKVNIDIQKLNKGEHI